MQYGTEKNIEKKKVILIFILMIAVNCYLSADGSKRKTIEDGKTFDKQELAVVGGQKTISGTVSIDSIQYYLEAAEKEQNKNPKKSIEFGKRALLIAERNKDISSKADALLLIGEGLEIEGEKDLAMPYFKEAYKIYLELNSSEGKTKALNNIAIIHYKNNETDSAIVYYKKALQINKENSNTKEIAKSLNNIGSLYIMLAKYGDALKYINELLQVNLILSNKADIAETYGYLGYIHLKLGNYDGALDNYLKELKLREELGSKEEIVKFLTNIGKIYYKINQYTKALEYFQKALTINQEKGNKIEIAKSLSNLGNVYYELKDYKKALSYYHKSLDFTDEKQINTGLTNSEKLSFLKGKAILLNNMGLVYKNLGDYKKALDYCKNSIEIKEEIGDDNNLFYPLTSIAEILLKLEIYDESLKYLSRALDIAEKSNNLMLKKEAHFLIYEVYATTGNFKYALDHHKHYMAIKDSLIQISTNKLISEYQTKMETEKKEQENKALREANSLQRNYFLIISALIMLTLVVTFSRYRSKQKANKLLSEKNAQIHQQHQELEYMFSKLQAKEEVLSEANATKDKFFSIIAHDLKNPLHAITLSSDLLMSKYDVMNKEQLTGLIKNIHSAGANLSSLLENLLQWSRAQNGKINFAPTAVDLFRIIEENFALLDVFARKKNLVLHSNIEPETYALADSNMLKTIFRNLLSNAIKFSNQDSQVIVDLDDSDMYFYEISVIDRGIGISAEDIAKLFRIDVEHTTIGTSHEKGTGLGLILCKEFIELNGGKIHVESRMNEGSKFVLSLPKAINKSIDQKTRHKTAVEVY
ncbi:MAG: tetratricopeptide repeat-containing sensor histidine kinase [bacterium]